MGDPDHHRALVRAEVARRGLASVMNQTRWLELRGLVDNMLPFAPAYRRQDVLGPRDNHADDEQPTYHGDWGAEALEPFYGIEHLLIFPERWDRAGRLMPLTVVETCREALEAGLRRYCMPWTRRGRAILVCGYVAPGDDFGAVHD
jgi:hypothetical protein